MTSVSTRRIVAFSFAALAVGVGLAVLGGLLLTGEEGAGAAGSETPSGTIAVGDPAPPLAGRDPNTGALVVLARVKKKPVVVHVWASWCVPCAREAPVWRRFARAHREAAVIGLDLQDVPEDAAAFAGRFGWTHRIISDPEGAQAARLGIENLPATLFLNRDHVIVSRLDGVADDAALEDGLAEAKRTP